MVTASPVESHPRTTGHAVTEAAQIFSRMILQYVALKYTTGEDEVFGRKIIQLRPLLTDGVYWSYSPKNKIHGAKINFTETVNPTMLMTRLHSTLSRL